MVCIANVCVICWRGDELWFAEIGGGVLFAGTGGGVLFAEIGGGVFAVPVVKQAHNNEVDNHVMRVRIPTNKEHRCQAVPHGGRQCRPV